MSEVPLYWWRKDYIRVRNSCGGKMVLALDSGCVVALARREVQRLRDGEKEGKSEIEREGGRKRERGRGGLPTARGLVQ